MLQFLFGRGSWIAWYAMFWLVVVVGLLLPTLAFLPLKRAGEKPDTASLGSVAVVFFMAAVLGFLTLVDVSLFSRIVAAHWFHKLMLALAAGTVIGVAAYFPAAHLATAQRLHSMWLWSAFAGACVAGNLALLWFAQTRAPLSLRWDMPWYLVTVLILLSLPAMGMVVLIVLGTVINFVRYRQ